MFTMRTDAVARNVCANIHSLKARNCKRAQRMNTWHATENACANARARATSVGAFVTGHKALRTLLALPQTLNTGRFSTSSGVDARSRLEAVSLAGASVENPLQIE